MEGQGEDDRRPRERREAHGNQGHGVAPVVPYFLYAWACVRLVGRVRQSRTRGPLEREEVEQWAMRREGRLQAAPMGPQQRAAGLLASLQKNYEKWHFMPSSVSRRILPRPGGGFISTAVGGIFLLRFPCGQPGAC